MSQERISQERISQEPRRHAVSAAPGTVTDVFDRALPPVLTIRPGDTVVVGSLDASGYLARQRHPGDEPPQLISAPRAPGKHSTIPPRSEGGGNIDCRELVAGSVLWGVHAVLPGGVLGVS